MTVPVAVGGFAEVRALQVALYAEMVKDGSGDDNGVTFPACKCRAWATLVDR